MKAQKAGVTGRKKFWTQPPSQVQDCQSAAVSSKSLPAAIPATTRRIPSTSRRPEFLICTPGACRPMSPVQSILILLHHHMQMSNHERHQNKSGGHPAFGWRTTGPLHNLPSNRKGLFFCWKKGCFSAPLSSGNVHTGIHLHFPCSSSVWLTCSVAVERN